MTRILKHHDDRLNELLDISQGLFFRNGYESTSVHHIIVEAGVAKGTFYHYFKSKEDLLDQLVERWTMSTLERVKELVMDKTDLNAIEKLNSFFITIRNHKMENLELIKVLMMVLYKEENLILRHKMFKKSIEFLTPNLVKILYQGIREGVFKLKNVEDSAELFFSMSLNLGDIVVQLLMDAEEKPENIDKIENKLRTYQGFLEKILGAKEGSVSIVERRIIEAFAVKYDKNKKRSGSVSRP